jgi:UDP-N-acetylmuramate--alanine ligase
MVRAKEKGVPVAQRAEILAELLNEKQGIYVTGAHGKTTTTSLIGQMLVHAGLDPTIFVGAQVEHFSGNVRCGKGDYFVSEADESDASFLYFKPDYAVFTNIDYEHLDYYKDIKNIEAAFAQGMQFTKKRIFCSADDQRIKTISQRYPEKLTTFGFSQTADFSPQEISLNGFGSQYLCLRQGQALGKITLSVPGYHNIFNSLAAVAVGVALGIPFTTIQQALFTYKGAQRRCEIKFDAHDILVIEDYAHHPTEIRTTLEAIRHLRQGRLICIFQPHRYSRTQLLMDEFAHAFPACDHLVLTDIYAACEEPIAGVNARRIYEAVNQTHSGKASYLEKEKIAAHVLEMLKPGDIVVVMGAGDIGELASELSQRLQGILQS